MLLFITATTEMSLRTVLESSTHENHTTFSLLSTLLHSLALYHCFFLWFDFRVSTSSTISENPFTIRSNINRLQENVFNN